MKDIPSLAEWLKDAPFELVCSSGFFGFFAHAGMLTALVDEGHVPCAVAGSSAGALVASGFAAGVDPDAFQREMAALTRADFWDPFPGLGFLRGRRFRALLERVFPVDDFASTRIPARVSVFDVRRLKTRVLDAGPIVPAVHASCAVPLMFHPVVHAGGLLVDGGVRDRPGLAGVAPGARALYHHLPTTAKWRLDRSVPRRAGMVSLVLRGLPRPGPFRLDEGPRAFAAARNATRRALARPVDDAVLAVDADR